MMVLEPTAKENPNACKHATTRNSNSRCLKLVRLECHDEKFSNLPGGEELKISCPHTNSDSVYVTSIFISTATAQFLAILSSTKILYLSCSAYKQSLTRILLLWRLWHTSFSYLGQPKWSIWHFSTLHMHMQDTLVHNLHGCLKILLLSYNIQN